MGSEPYGNARRQLQKRSKDNGCSHKRAQGWPPKATGICVSWCLADEAGNSEGVYCRCGREKILANGHCATCYTLRRQDERHFGGLRERVLERDGHTCRGCGASGRDKRSIVVHHRRPGRSRLDLMISLCPACHARIHRTQAVLSEMPDLLLELWRELHPRGHEQTALDFRWRAAEARPVPLFNESGAGK